MTDTEAVTAAVLDYFEGWYDADLERIDGVLHPALLKRSIVQVTGPEPSVTTKERILQLVGEGGGADDRTDDPIEVAVVDVHLDIAAAVVRSTQYREYVHLARTPEGWKVVGSFWQFTDPEASP